MLFKKILALTVSLIAVTCLPRVAHAWEWNDYNCDINDSADALNLALDLYNEPDQTKRSCLGNIRFFTPQTINITNEIAITQLPSADLPAGVAIRRCKVNEDGCQPMNDTDVVLNFAAHTENDGKCPIRIIEGARIEIHRIKIVAPVPELAICHHGTDEPVAFEDQTSPYAWIEGVTIEASAGPPAPTDPTPAESASCALIPHIPSDSNSIAPAFAFAMLAFIRSARRRVHQCHTRRRN